MEYHVGNDMMKALFCGVFAYNGSFIHSSIYLFIYLPVSSTLSHTPCVGAHVEGGTLRAESPFVFSLSDNPQIFMEYHVGNDMMKTLFCGVFAYNGSFIHIYLSQINADVKNLSTLVARCTYAIYLARESPDWDVQHELLTMGNASTATPKPGDPDQGC